MSNRNFVRTVAKATGESVEFIRKMGFSPMKLSKPKPSKRARRLIAMLAKREAMAA